MFVCFIYGVVMLNIVVVISGWFLLLFWLLVDFLFFNFESCILIIVFVVCDRIMWLMWFNLVMLIIELSIKIFLLVMYGWICFEVKVFIISLGMLIGNVFIVVVLMFVFVELLIVRIFDSLFFLNVCFVSFEVVIVVILIVLFWLFLIESFFMFWLIRW